jgi:hypothetical protein
MTIKFTAGTGKQPPRCGHSEKCYREEAYRGFGPDVRRRFNQALFVRILVDQDGEIELSSPNRSR